MCHTKFIMCYWAHFVKCRCSFFQLSSTQCTGRSESCWIGLCLCMSSNCLPCLSLLCDGFYHITRDHWSMCGRRRACIVVVNHVSNSFSKPAANPFFCSCQAGMVLICQRSETASSEDMQTFAAEYEDVKVNMNNQRYNHTQSQLQSHPYGWLTHRGHPSGTCTTI